VSDKVVDAVEATAPLPGFLTVTARRDLDHSTVSPAWQSISRDGLAAQISESVPGQV
jgi:hypothetical protein